MEGDKHTTIKGDKNEKINGTLSRNIDMDQQEKVGSRHALQAGSEIHLKAGMNVVIEAGMSITLKAGGGFIVVGPAGVTLSGIPVLINSGGAPGSGSGCTPDMAKPPLEADTAIPGQVSKVRPPRTYEKKPPTHHSTNPQAQALAKAAEDGSPFVGIYEEPAKLTPGVAEQARHAFTNSLGGVDGAGVTQKTPAPDNTVRYAKGLPSSDEVLGTFDKGFVALGSQKKVNAAFDEIKNAFGAKYAANIRKLFDSSNVNFYRGLPTDDTLGIFKTTKKGPAITLNTNIGNSKVFANTILHEVRHLRQYNKLSVTPKQWNALDNNFVERFATATNIWQGKKLGLSNDDIRLFQNYYDGYRQ